MIDHAGGRVVRSEAPTVFSTSGRIRTIDFFIVSGAVAPLVDARGIFEEAATKPAGAASSFQETRKPAMAMDSARG